MDEHVLQELRASLLRRRPEPPPNGDEAFEEHQILAMAVHRAVKLIQQEKGEGEGKAWIRYVRTFFPRGRNGEREARELWTDWRTQLVKYETPGAKVAVSHGQAHAHWKRDGAGVLYLNLESLWDDFERSVEKLIGKLRADDALRADVFKRWRERAVVVRPFRPADAAYAVATASFASSVTHLGGHGGD